MRIVDKNFNLDWRQDDKYYISYLHNKYGYAGIIHEKS